MNVDYTIQQLYQMTWGYRGLPYPQGDLSSELNILPGLSRKNALGREMFMPLTLGTWELPVEPIMSITGSKRIVETPLAGNTRRGNVLELINTESYLVRIRGMLINHTGTDYPENDVKQLFELYEKNESINVLCDLTTIFEIERIAIKELRLPEMVGVQNAQAYELLCVSDEDFILIKD